MRLMWAMRSHTSAFSTVLSQSVARRRHFPSQAKMRSTTHPNLGAIALSAGADQLELARIIGTVLFEKPNAAREIQP